MAQDSSNLEIRMSSFAKHLEGNPWKRGSYDVADTDKKSGRCCGKHNTIAIIFALIGLLVAASALVLVILKITNASDDVIKEMTDNASFAGLQQGETKNFNADFGDESSDPEKLAAAEEIQRKLAQNITQINSRITTNNKDHEQFASELEKHRDYLGELSQEADMCLERINQTALQLTKVESDLKESKSEVSQLRNITRDQIDGLDSELQDKLVFLEQEITNTTHNLDVIYKLQRSLETNITFLINEKRIPGPKGGRGDPGTHGEKGARGDIGPKGSSGSIGVPGVRGEKGNAGAPGTMGRKGEPGAVGLPGPLGKNGLPGVAGVKGDIGPPGTPGRVGMSGMDGIKGNAGKKGEHGSLGLPGLNGAIGPKGTRGLVGPRGIQGLPGLNGTIGLPGTQGMKGEPGSHGLLGSRGPIGPKGDRGEIGIPGIRGLAGLNGSVGAPGIPGIKGEPGVAGLKGTKGSVGPKGIQGHIGVPGIPGVSGLKGSVGPKGNQGYIGVPGAPGDPGLKGSVGPKGERGQIGKPGIQGLLGPKGSVGPKGESGHPGESGISGLQGAVGPKGDQGNAGQPGLPALPGVKGAIGPKGEPGITGPVGPKGDRGQMGVPGEDGLPGTKGSNGSSGGAGPPGSCTCDITNITASMEEFRRIAAQFQVICSSALDRQSTSSGVLTTPGYPNQYPNSKDCSTTISPPSSSTLLRYSFTDFQLEENESCSFDYVEIYDGNSKRGKYCGTTTPPSFTSSAAVRVVFHTDGSVTRTGFRMQWTLA